MKRVNHSAAFNLDEIPDVSIRPDRELVAIDPAKRDALLEAG